MKSKLLLICYIIDEILFWFLLYKFCITLDPLWVMAWSLHVIARTQGINKIKAKQNKVQE